jgi:LmbE family N-acetylglucosaminyl deacetylase
MIVAPHQDDETLGCGGLIALKRERGAAVQAVFLTDGSAATNQEPGKGQNAFTQMRKQEALAALKILGVDEASVFFLDMPDSHLSEAPQGEIAAERLSKLLATHRPQEVYAPHHHDRHPDHEAAWRITQAAIRQAGLSVDLVQYPIWMMWSAPLFFRLTPRHLAGAHRLCVRSALSQKRRAIAAYPSQCATLPKGFLDQFLGPCEIFFRSEQHKLPPA